MPVLPVLRERQVLPEQPDRKEAPEQQDQLVLRALLETLVPRVQPVLLVRQV